MFRRGFAVLMLAWGIAARGAEVGDAESAIVSGTVPVPRAAVPPGALFLFPLILSFFVLLSSSFLPSFSFLLLLVRRANGCCGLPATGGGSILDGLIALHAQSRPQRLGLPCNGAPPL